MTVTCPGCARWYSSVDADQRAFCDLEVLQHRSIPGLDDDPDMLLELRRCVCGHVIHVDLYVTGVVDRPRKDER